MKNHELHILIDALCCHDEPACCSDEPKANKYQRQINGATLDVYDVLQAWGVTNPAIQHAIKKLLQPGQRGHKDLLQDLQEAHESIVRAIELEAAQA